MRNALFIAISTSLLAVALVVGGGDPAHAATSRTNIDTQPSGAEVYLVEPGGDKLIGVTPIKLYRLPRGNIKLKIKKEGYETLEQNVNIVVRIDTFMFNLVRSIQPATLEFISAAEFTGAQVTVDGKPEGVIPLSVRVSPGRHQVVITKEGYEPWDRWVEVTEKQKVSFDVVLTRMAAAPGELLVTSNPSGADVRVNGAPRGKTPMVVEGVAPGQAFVEVVADEYAPFTRTVAVESGKRIVVDAQLQKAAGSGGEVRILANRPDVTILFDGEDVGKAPVTVRDVLPGTHLVEAQGADGARAAQEVQVRAGQATVVRLDLPEVAGPAATKARVRIVANVPGAQVDIGGRKGPSPLVVDDLEPGTHFVTVTAPGFSPWQRSVKLDAGDNPEVIAELGQAGQADIRTRGGEPAEIFVNGQPVGETPFVGELPVGTHNVMLRRADGKTEEFRIAVAPDRIVKVTAAFGEEDPNAVPANTRPMPWSARAMPAGTGSIDMHAGWPYLVGFQAGGGIGSNMDVGVQARFAFTVMNELEARYQWTYAATRTVAASVEAGLGAGLGADDRNTFFGRLDAKGSVMVGERAAITARVGLLMYTDRLGPEDDPSTEERDAGARLTLGFSVEVRITRALNAFLIFDGDPLGGGRKLYEVDYLSDPKMYGALGVSYMF